VWTTTRTGAKGAHGSRHSRRHSLSCHTKACKPHSIIPTPKCRAVRVAGLPRRLPEGTTAWLCSVTYVTTCCSVGTGSSLARSDTLSWVIRRNSFRLYTDLVKGLSFFCSVLATSFPILLESMP